MLLAVAGVVISQKIKPIILNFRPEFDVGKFLPYEQLCIFPLRFSGVSRLSLFSINPDELILLLNILWINSGLSKLKIATRLNTSNGRY